MEATLFDPSGPETAPPQELLQARYRLQVRIGRGGMGEVWRATDHKLGREVALKLVLPGESLERRFHTEIRAAALLDHPNILPIYDSGQLPDGRPYYTMRLVPEGRCFLVGGPLRAQLQVLHSVMQALAYAHEKGVIHRDLKPANILLGAFGEVLLADWGIAHFLGEPEALRPGKSLGHCPICPRSSGVERRTNMGPLPMSMPWG